MGHAAVMTVKQGITLLVIDVASRLLLVRLRVTTEAARKVVKTRSFSFKVS